MSKDPVFEIFKSPKDGQHYWRLVGGNGEIMASSEGYVTKQHARRAIVRLGQCFGTTLRAKEIASAAGEVEL